MTAPLSFSTKNQSIMRISLIASVLIMAVKFLAFHYTGSTAVLSDLLESIVDVTAAGFGLYSVYISALPVDENHPYGHGKIEFFAAAFEGGMITLSAIGIIWQAIETIINPAPLQALDWGLGLMFITGSANWLLGFQLIRIGKKTGSPVLISNGTHLKADGLSTAGVMLGLLGIIITGWQLIDNITALIMSCLILKDGYFLIRKSIAGLMDEADPVMLKKVVDVLKKHRQAEWIDIHNLRVIQVGAAIHIDCHVTLPWYWQLREVHDKLNELHQLLSQQLNTAVEVFIHADPCTDTCCAICQIAHCQERKVNFEYTAAWTIENIKQNLKHSKAQLKANNNN
jgi:cation diffusion facilitator family transporter